MERPLHKLQGYNVQRTAHAPKMTAGLGLQLWLEGIYLQSLRRAGQEPLRSLVVGNTDLSNPCLSYVAHHQQQ